MDSKENMREFSTKLE